MGRSWGWEICQVYLWSWQIQSQDLELPISSDEKHDRSVSWPLRLTQQGITQSWCQIFLVRLQSENAIRNCLTAFSLILCKLQSGRKVKCSNNPFFFVLTVTIGERNYLHLTDENRLREGKWLLLGHPERKWAQSHVFKSKVPSARPSCLLCGDSKPGRERHTYLIPSCSGLHLPTLWDHHRQLGLIVGACGNILRQKAQWRFRYSDTHRRFTDVCQPLC